MIVTVVDSGLLLGPCPFRTIPSAVADVLALREAAGFDRAVAMGFRSLLYFDPIAGLEQDLAEYESLAEWLHFYAVLNPEFPQWAELLQRASADRRLVAVRLVPALHHYALDAPIVGEIVGLAGELQLPVNLMARVFDDRVAPRFVDQQVPSMQQVANFLTRCGETRVILSMFYFSELQALPVDWASLPNVYVDFGCCKPNVASLDQLRQWFPLQRALFGTGAPFYYWQGSRLGLAGARMHDEARSGILGRNALEVFAWD